MAPELTEEQRKELEEKLKQMSPEELKEFQKKQCIFCQIISGKVPSQKIYEDNKVLVILDINPAAKGHLLILPKEHYSIQPQIPDKEQGHLFSIAKNMSHLLLKGLKVSGTSLFAANGLVAGQKAQHFILHLLPRKEGDDILKVSEKLIEKEMRDKIYSLVASKFNEVMGGKKKTVVPLKGPKLISEEKPKALDDSIITDSEVTDSAVSVINNPIPESIIAFAKEKQTKPKTKAKLKKSAEKQTKSEKKASLDDIANLFK